MAVGLIVFLSAIGWATFLESMYDTQTAKIFVYNALWFEVLLTFLGINLIGNIFTYRLYKREKIASFMFHLSFLVILVGAATTRFFSFEGSMDIGEGQISNVMYLKDPHFWYTIKSKNNPDKIEVHRLFMSEQANNYFNYDVEIKEHPNEISIEFVDFRKKLIDSLVINDSIEETALTFVTNQGQRNQLTEGHFLMIGDIALSYKKKDAMPGIIVTREGRRIMMESDLPIRYLPMSEMRKFRESGMTPPDSLYIDIPVDTIVPLELTTLYQVNGQQFVLSEITPHAKMVKLPSGKKDIGEDYLTVKITDGQHSEIVELKGGEDRIPDYVSLTLNGLTYELAYGSMPINIPFYVGCDDFRLERYAGSTAPSSFESDLKIIDDRNGFKKNKTVFMNHVMDYDGYRFFQSSYRPDESGTILSVNHDWWGTNITYFGYLMMSIGMIMSLFSPKGRMRELLGKLKQSLERQKNNVGMFIAALLISGTLSAQHEGHNHNTHNHDHENQKKDVKEKPEFHVMSVEHSDEIASLLVQDYEGRIVPLHTLCDQILRKISRRNTFDNYNAVQSVMSMHMYPAHWFEKEIIYVSKNIRPSVKIEGSYVSMKKLMDEEGNFILLKEYESAHNKMESKRNEFDKNVIKLADKFFAAQNIFTWAYMRWLPVQNDNSDDWYVPLSAELLQKDSISSKLALQYLNALDEAMKNGKYGNAGDLLNEIKDFQYKAGGNIVPSKTKVNIEVRYNKLSVNKKSMYAYLLLGFILLVLFVVKVSAHPGEKAQRTFKLISRILVGLIALVFVFHGMGLGMRWYISGHAPWSNGYEAIVFIAWGVIIAGFLFVRWLNVILAMAAILAFMMLFVSEMNLLDPEITPLVPVLKSYWLMIHVAIITSSYAFLGLAAMLGFLNLFLFIFRNKNNGKTLSTNIVDLTHVTEMLMIIGVFMLTIGTFLGGVWANESWGRYWGWDPKETWAMVSVLVYAVILHFRFIPGWRGKFAFNVASLWGYSAILFTFFGVNFVLVGMHSYANGESNGVFTPGINITIAAFGILTAIAYFRYRSYEKSIKNLKS